MPGGDEAAVPDDCRKDQRLVLVLDCIHVLCAKFTFIYKYKAHRVTSSLVYL